MFRKFAFVLAILTVGMLVIAAGGKKKTTSGGGLSTITVNTSTITASEGTTAIAIRGIIAPEGATNAVVVAIHPSSGVVTVRMRRTGAIYKVTSAAAGDLEVGDPASVNVAARSLQIGSAQWSVTPAVPCCQIAAINAGAGLVTISEPALGRSFQVNLQGATPQLAVGQKVEADFKAGKVTLAGTQFSIVNVTPAKLPGL